MKAFPLLVICALFAVKTFAQKVDSLRIITYNIHHAAPPSKPGVIDIEAIISTLKKYPADVIALQEVDVNTKRSGDIDEAKAIADGLGLYSYFAKAIDHDGGFYGVALLSKFPLNNASVIRLPMDTTVKGEQRVLATATIKLPSGRSVVVGCTHLDHQKDSRSRDLQMAQIISFAKTTSQPFVLAGDFNAQIGSSTLQLFDQVFQRTCEPCAPTFPADRANRTIDFIGYKKLAGIKTISHQVIPETYASDHLPVRAVINFGK